MSVGVESLALALGPLWSAKRNARKARRSVQLRHTLGSAAVRVVSPVPMPDTPTARYRRYQPTEHVPEHLGSERESPVDDVPTSPQPRDGVVDYLPKRDAETALLAATMSELQPEPEPEPEQPTTKAAQESDEAVILQSRLGSDKVALPAAQKVCGDEAIPCTRQALARTQLLHDQAPTSTSQVQIHVRPWDRGWNLPQQSFQRCATPATTQPEKTRNFSSASAPKPAVYLDEQSWTPPSPPQRQEKTRANKLKQSLPPVSAKPVAVSQHGKRLGIPKHVCEDCRMQRPVYGDEGTTEWRNSRWCEDCAKCKHAQAVPTHPFAAGWTYTINGTADTVNMRAHWQWNWEGKGKPIDAPTFTHFRTVSQVQDLAKKLNNSAWPQNGWTATNYAKRERFAGQETYEPLEAPFVERDRAYFGDWTSCERERQFVEAKLCTPARGLPHAEGCNASSCRGECLSVPQYHKPLPGGTGGPRSLQSQQERARMTMSPVYIPGSQGGTVDDGPVVSSSCTSDRPVASRELDRTGNMTTKNKKKKKKVAWKEIKKHREEQRGSDIESARLQAKQTANATASVAVFRAPETYNAQLASEIGILNASMPQGACPTTCMVEGKCQCRVGARPE